MYPRRKVAVILQLWQNYDREILQGIAAYVRERRDWSVFVEEVEHQRIPDFNSWDGDGLIVNFDNARVVRSLSLRDGFPTTVDGPRPPAAATDVFEDASPPAGKAFYRIEEVP